MSHNTTCSEKTNSSSGAGSTLSLSNEQMNKLMTLLGESTGIQSNMAGNVFNESKIFNSNFSKFFNSQTSLKGSFMLIPGLIVDSGANQHMTGTSENLINVVDVSDLKISVGHPNGTQAFIKQIGNMKISDRIILYDVLVIPEYCVSLLSVQKLAKDCKLFVGFDEDTCYIQDSKTRTTVGTGRESDGLYILDVKSKFVGCSSVSSCYLSKVVWHSRLGHPADQVLHLLKSRLNLDGKTSLSPCEVCHRAKQTRESFPLSDHKTTGLGDLVHLDVWGPYRVTSRDGYRYFLTVVDDYSRAVWVFLLKSKDEVYLNIKVFFNLLKNQFGKTVKIFRSDNGTEFLNDNVDLFFKENGIIHQTSCTYTPQQNGIVERKHRHLLNVSRSLMFQGGIPLYLWTECVLTAVYLINRLPSSVLNGKSPCELVYSVEPSLSHLRSFGCLCFSKVLNCHDKFASKSEKCVFIGYSSSKKGYKLFSLYQKTIIFSRDVQFYENVFPFKMSSDDKVTEANVSDVNHLNFFNLFGSENSNNLNKPNDDEKATQGEGSGMDIPGSSAESASESLTTTTPNDEIVEQIAAPEGKNTNVYENSNLRRSTRTSTQPKRFNDFVLNNKVKFSVDKVVNYSQLSAENYCFVSNLNKTNEPSNYKEAMLDNRWVEAMNAEMEALYRNETFSPVVKMVTVRCVLSLVVNNNWPLFQLDVNNAFLYGRLTEEVYMTLPEGYFSGNETKVCKLVKSLYGLKQAPRKWNERLTETLVENGFVQSVSDYSLFVKNKNGVFIVLLVYVDDIVITGNNQVEIDKFKVYLNSKFLIKDLGKLKYFLGIEVLQSDSGICLSQRKYALDLLAEFGMTG